jgi:hypothetical protein
MPVHIDGVEYYHTNEACSEAGITKNTYLRWVASQDYPDVSYRDRRGWRLFTKEEVEHLKQEANKIQVAKKHKTIK